MFDIGWAELVIVGVVALIVIGPKDLPEMFRTLGRFTAKLRSMSRDFQRAMDSAAKESGVKDVASDLKTMTSPKNLGLDAVKNAATKFEKWDPLKPKPAAPKPAAVAAAPVIAAPSAAAPSAAAPSAAASSEATPPAATPVTAMGPATQALADKVAAKKVIVQEAAAKLRAVSAPPAPAVADPVPAKKPGRVRSAQPKAEAVAKTKAPPKPKTTKTKGE